MSFNPHSVDDAIRQAGSLLQEMWKKPGQMPENDLHPDSASLAFRIKLLEDRCNLLEATLGKVVRHLNGK